MEYSTGVRNQDNTNIINRLQENILDSTKNFKSNDNTFHISTLPHLSDKLINLMEKCIGVSQKLQACETAFVNVTRRIEEEDECDPDEYAETDTYLKLFDRCVADELKSLVRNDTNLKQLKRIIQVDEDIREEVPIRQHIPKDPITKMDITCAVKSNVCNHVYDKESIEAYISQKERTKRRIQCPQAGCANLSMTRDEIVPDEEINNLIQSSS